MNIPEKIDIAGHEVRIEIKDILLDHERQETAGFAYLNSERIEIAKFGKEEEEASEDNQAETLLHEIVHLVSDKWYIELKEDQVEKLATGLYQVLKNNRLQFF